MKQKLKFWDELTDEQKKLDNELEYKISYLIKKFINHITVDGKKQKAEKIFLETMDLVKEKEKINPISVFYTSIVNVTPVVELRSVRKGGAYYQIPVPVKEKRAISIGIKWIVSSSRKKQGPISMKLYYAFCEAYSKRGESIKRKDDLEKQALKNRSLSHYRWF